jgi:glycerol-3-phosphate O-acyltransferase
VVSDLAKQMMVNINAAAATNALTLCGMAILCSHQRAMSREELVAQLDCYLNLLRNVPYSQRVTVPDESAEELVHHAAELNKFDIEKDSVGEIFSLDRREAILMTYYRNNILHLFALPALIAHLIVAKQKLSLDELQQQVALLFPFMKEELFINIKQHEFEDKTVSYVNELFNEKLITFDGQNIAVSNARLRTLRLLGRSVTETLQSYAIVVTILNAKPSISKSELESESQLVAQRLSRLHNINAPEFYDKAVLSKFVENLKLRGYLNTEDNVEELPEKTSQVVEFLYKLVSPEFRTTVQAVMESES